jgi:hypothetical protein
MANTRKMASMLQGVLSAFKQHSVIQGHFGWKASVGARSGEISPHLAETALQVLSLPKKTGGAGPGKSSSEKPGNAGAARYLSGSGSVLASPQCTDAVPHAAAVQHKLKVGKPDKNASTAIVLSAIALYCGSSNSLASNSLATTCAHARLACSYLTRSHCL